MQKLFACTNIIQEKTLNGELGNQNLAKNNNFCPNQTISGDFRLDYQKQWCKLNHLDNSEHQKSVRVLLFGDYLTYGSRFDQYADPQFATLETYEPQYVCAFFTPFFLFYRVN